MTAIEWTKLAYCSRETRNGKRPFAGGSGLFRGLFLRGKTGGQAAKPPAEPAQDPGRPVAGFRLPIRFLDPRLDGGGLLARLLFGRLHNFVLDQAAAFGSHGRCATANTAGHFAARIGAPHAARTTRHLLTGRGGETLLGLN